MAYIADPDPHCPSKSMGLDIKQIGQVNGFVRSLHLQKESAGQGDELPATRRKMRHVCNERPMTWRRPNLSRPRPLNFRPWKSRCRMTSTAISSPSLKGDPAKWGGIIVGSGVIGLAAPIPSGKITSTPPESSSPS